MKKPNKNTTQKKYIFGDFDKDGVKNIDDTYPFDPQRSKHPSIYNHPEYYYECRLGGTEIELSAIIKKIQKANNKQARHLRKFIKENPGAKGRVKTVASTIDKMYRKSYHTAVRDVVAVRISTKNRKQVRKKARYIKKKYKVDPTRIKDYYKKPKMGTHHALHVGLITGKIKTDTGFITKHMELQIQSRKMEELDYKVHPKYKMGLSLDEFKPEATQLFMLGF